jgi:2-oxoglutarate dehydrogenase E2 component (dihydrolipoamide succinyltransferase)
MTDVRVPKLNNNDSQYILVEWLVADGDQVRPGDVVATLETSKALEDLVCQAEGILRHHIAEKSECEPGQVLGRVERPGQPATRAVAEPATPPPPGPAPTDIAPTDIAPADIVVTAPARSRLAELGIEPDRLRRFGQRVIRREDVDRLLELERQDAAVPATPAPAEMPRHQQAVAATVARSHAVIPPAYLAVRVEVAAALELAARLRTELRRFVGLAELLVAAVARQHREFPLCFASAGEQGSVVLAAGPHVGITVDVGTGLYVPVVRDAANRSVAEITETVSRFRDTALRGRFRASELSGANIMVALHTDDDVLFGVPIVFPGHACAISLSGTRQELSLGPDGAVSSRPVVTLGVAHDHRVVNGQDAAKFLRAVKAALEDPNSLNNQKDT